MSVPDFPAAPDAAAAGSGGAPAPAPRLFAGGAEPGANDELRKVITDSIHSDSWKDSGGSVGAIRELNGRLIVTNTPEVQEQVAELLSQFRGRAPVSVRIRAHWVLARRPDLDALLKPAGRAEKADKAEKTPGPRNAAPPAAAQPAVATRAAGAPGASGAVLEADPAALEKVRGAVHFRAETLCTNGQRVGLTTTRSRPYLVDLVPVVNEGVAKADRAWDTYTNDLTLDVQCTVAEDASNAVVTVRSRWVTAGPAGAPEEVRRTVTTRPATAPDTPAVVAQATGQVEHIQTGEHQLRTTARIPLGRTVLIGGMTVDPTVHGTDAPTDGESPQLYLFVEVTAD